MSLAPASSQCRLAVPPDRVGPCPPAAPAHCPDHQNNRDSRAALDFLGNRVFHLVPPAAERPLDDTGAGDRDAALWASNSLQLAIYRRGLRRAVRPLPDAQYPAPPL